MIVAVNGKRPVIGKEVYIAPNAVIVGDVVLKDRSSVWFGAVIRGDEGRIVIGEGTSVQDNCVVHVNASSDTVIEGDVTIGHGVVMEGCTIQKGTLIGMNATILSHAQIGEGALIAAGSVVREHFVVPAHHMAAGVPAKIIQPLSAELKARIAKAPGHYAQSRRCYLEASQIIYPLKQKQKEKNTLKRPSC